MELKEFLKPTLMKLILWVIIFLIFPTYAVGLICPLGMGTTCSSTQLIPLFGGFLSILSIILSIDLILQDILRDTSCLINGSCMYMYISPFQNLNIGFFIFSLIISYILSCLVFYIYSKYKK